MFCFLAGNSFTVSKKYQQPIAFCVADKRFVFCSPEKESLFSCVTSKHFLQAENIPILHGKQKSKPKNRGPSGSGSGSFYPGFRIRIRIRIKFELLDPDPDPHTNCGSGSRRAKPTQNNRKKDRIFIF
jgi:hypothetical protein